MPLRLPALEGGRVTGTVTVKTRIDGRIRTLGSAAFDAGHRSLVPVGVEVGPRLAARLRRGGGVPATVEVYAKDDLGDWSHRWLPLTIEAAQPVDAGSSPRAASSASTASSQAP